MSTRTGGGRISLSRRRCTACDWLKFSHRKSVGWKRATYSTRLENTVIVGCDSLRGNYRISLPGNERLRAVLDFETPSLPAPILVLQLAPTGR